MYIPPQEWGELYFEKYALTNPKKNVLMRNYYYQTAKKLWFQKW